MKPHIHDRLMRLLGQIASVGLLTLVMSTPNTVRADERLKGIACRSVHLHYPGPEATAFYNEVTVDHSADGTYFCVCGFRRGYYGIQEKANGKKVLIFSVWDAGKQNDPKKVKGDKRVQVLYHDKQVLVRRFGNEGTGGQSFFNYAWKKGHTYRFLVTAKKLGERTAFTAYFFVPEDKAWKKLVTFSTLAGGKQLRGYYSFVEDFRRNRISTKKVRRARFGNGWVRTSAGRWGALENARFTADRNPVLNIDAGRAKKAFYLTTGGDTRNGGTPLGKTMQRPAGTVPEDVRTLLRAEK